MANKTFNKSSYIGAPYNFVPFAPKVYAPVSRDKMAVRDKLDNSLITGEISYRITAKTPIIVDKGDGHFFRDEYEKIAIPGSTIRGLIRNNAQVLSASDISSDIDDYSLMFRHVAAGALKKEYNETLGNKPVKYGKVTISVLQNVKAGAITCKAGKYYIYPTRIAHIDNNNSLPNYYVLSERTIVGDYLKNKDKFSYNFFVRNGKSIMQHEHNKPFEKKGSQYEGTTNKVYKPYSLECSYDFSGKNITGVANAGILKNKGTVISTGKMQYKKAIYIIPEIDYDESKKILIPDSDVKAYNIDYAKKENTLAAFFDKDKKKAKAFYGLPEEGKTKVLFYIQLGKKLYFGFTPRLRLFYDHSIKEGLRQEIAEKEQYDLCNSLFGMTNDSKGSYKSKVSFGDASLISGKEKNREKVVLAEPKPSSYLDYVQQIYGGKTRLTTYHSDDFSLRGIKQYWLHDNIDIGVQNTKNDNVGSEIYPLEAGSIFYGKIRFQNLTALELGLLLWSLKLEPESQMNIGKGKPYGFGRVAVSNVQLRTIDNAKAYDLECLALNPYHEEDADKYVSEYKALSIMGQKLTELPSVKAFFKMKNTRIMPNPKDIRYMSIVKHEYQSRKERLPDIEEIISGKSQQIDASKSNRNSNRSYNVQDGNKPAGNGNNCIIEVRITKVSQNKNDSSKFVGLFDNGMVFDVPDDLKKGETVAAIVTKVRDDGYKFAKFKNRI